MDKRIVLAKLQVSRGLVRQVLDSLDQSALRSQCSEIVDILASFIMRCHHEL